MGRSYKNQGGEPANRARLSTLRLQVFTFSFRSSFSFSLPWFLTSDPGFRAMEQLRGMNALGEASFVRTSSTARRFDPCFALFLFQAHAINVADTAFLILSRYNASTKMKNVYAMRGRFFARIAVNCK